MGQLRKLGTTSSRREDNIKMVLKLLQRDGVHESVQRLEEGMESRGSNTGRRRKGFSTTPKRSYWL